MNTYKHWLYLRPLTAPERKRKPYTFARLTRQGSTITGLYVAEYEDQPAPLFSVAHWIERIEKMPGRIWYTYGGADSEFRYLIGPLLAKVQDAGWTITPIVQGSDRVIGYTITDHNHRYELRDGRAILSVDLSTLSRTFAPLPPQHETTHREHDCQLDDLYHRDDLNVLFAIKNAILEADRLLLQHFGVHAGWTAASTSLRAWRRTIDHHIIRQRPTVERTARDAYYGGLHYIRDYRPHRDYVALDINAAYAYAMRQGVPGGPGTFTTREAQSAYQPAIYRVHVTVPAGTTIPFIPWRTRHGTDYSSAGSFDTTITSDELYTGRAAGYEITIIDGFLFDGLIYPFDPYLEKIETLELSCQPEDPIRLVCKGLRNSLYGKFGARPTRKQWAIANEAPAEYYPTLWESAPRGTAMPDLIIDGLYWKESAVQRPHMLPHWAAWITAQARLHLINLATLIGLDEVLYMDTDSLFVPAGIAHRAQFQSPHLFGPRYGQLKVQARYQWLTIHGLKHYNYRKQDGRIGTVQSGIPADATEIQVSPLQLIRDPDQYTRAIHRQPPRSDLPPEEDIDEDSSDE